MHTDSVHNSRDDIDACTGLRNRKAAHVTALHGAAASEFRVRHPMKASLLEGRKTAGLAGRWMFQVTLAVTAMTDPTGGWSLGSGPRIGPGSL